MHSELYWIDAGQILKVAIMARPRAGDWLEDEVAHWKRSGVKLVVSLLKREEIDELELNMEGPLCAENGIEFLSFPIPDRGVPSDVNHVMRFAAGIVCKDIPVAIHCRAGIGRSSIIAAAVLVCSGISAEAALTAIGKARRSSIPDTDAQRAWVLNLERPSR